MWRASGLLANSPELKNVVDLQVIENTVGLSSVSSEREKNSLNAVMRNIRIGTIDPRSPGGHRVGCGGRSTVQWDCRPWFEHSHMRLRTACRLVSVVFDEGIESGGDGVVIVVNDCVDAGLKPSEIELRLEVVVVASRDDGESNLADAILVEDCREGGDLRGRKKIKADRLCKEGGGGSCLGVLMLRVVVLSDGNNQLR